MARKALQKRLQASPAIFKKLGVALLNKDALIQKTPIGQAVLRATISHEVYLLGMARVAKKIKIIR